MTTHQTASITYAKDDYKPYCTVIHVPRVRNPADLTIIVHKDEYNFEELIELQDVIKDVVNDYANYLEDWNAKRPTTVFRLIDSSGRLHSGIPY